MEAVQFVSEYFNSFRIIQESLLRYIENEDEQINYNEFISNFNKAKINEDKNKFKHYIMIMLKITNNHYHSPNFFDKIEKIFNFIKPYIINYFTNEEIFDIFKVNKRILLYFIEEQFLIIDKSFLPDDDSLFILFFYPEFNDLAKKYFDMQFIEENDIDTCGYPVLNEDELDLYVPEITQTDFQLFDSKRKLGEHDGTIFQMIREDAIEEFVAYVTKTNYNLSKHCGPSIYETNSFLNEHEPTLIEYAAFFGSIQIFQYLRFNNVKIKPSIWYYAIHGNNNELIHILEDDGIKSDDKSFYEDCYNQAIKCYNNDVANYIRDNYLYQKENDFFFGKMLENYNFIDLPQELKVDFNIFYYFCQLNYFEIVNLLVKNKLEFDINQKMIFLQYLNVISQSFILKILF